MCSDCSLSPCLWWSKSSCGALRSGALKKYSLRHVYIATDSTETAAVKHLEDSLSDVLLPRYSAGENEDPQFSAAVEAWLCSHGHVFVGTRTSSFSLLISTLRKIQQTSHPADGLLATGHYAAAHQSNQNPESKLAAKTNRVARGRGGQNNRAARKSQSKQREL